MSALEGARAAAPDATFRIAGEKIPREPHRYSGRTAMHANIAVSEPTPPRDPDSALAFSMEGAPLQPPPALLPYFWSPGWNSIQAVNKFQEEVAGPLRGGPAGIRLFEPDGAAAGYRGSPPQAFVRRQGEWLLIPIYHIFGSEELSSFAPAVRELAPAPYVALNPADASQLGAAAGGEIDIAGSRLPVRLTAEIARGCVGVPAGAVAFAGYQLPVWSKTGRP